MDDAHWDEIEEAAELLQVGSFDEALQELDAVLSKNPGNELAHTYRGHVLFERKDYAEALRAYVRALERKPLYLAAMVGAGQSLRYLGEHEKALRLAREALKVDRDDPDALFLAASVTFQRDERHACRGYLERFLATRPEAEAALEARGMLRVLDGGEDVEEDDS